MPIAKINGASMYYRVDGQGDPVLFIMGTGLSHKLWESQVRAFETKYRCVRYDNRGTGKTEKTRDAHSIRQYANDANALLEYLGIQKAHVIGWSLGSAIAQELAINHPSKVGSLVLISTWCRPYPFLRRRLEVQIGIAKTGNQRLLGEFSVMHLFRPDYIDAADQKITRFQRKYLEGKTRAPMETLIAHYKMDIKHDTSARLSRICVPTLVLGGAEDQLVRPSYQEEVHRRIAGSELHLIPKADHMALTLVPDQIQHAAMDFLERNFEKQFKASGGAA